MAQATKVRKKSSGKSSKKESGKSGGFMNKLKFSRNKSSKQSQQSSREMNGWILGDTLGMGGYSKVKLGINAKTGQKAALKIMFADEHGKISDSKKKQLIRELNVMKKVRHENVIQLIEFDENAEYPESDGRKTKCLLTVLEFASGGELFDFLMFTGCFDERATRSYFHQMISGLEAMHKIGIAHRDLKPENLLLNDKYVLKIADFGFATQFIDDSGKINKMKTACGTKGYLAPELLKGKKYTHKCDIFAIGIILFTTFAGFPPFQNAVDTDWWWDKLSKGWKYITSAEKQKYQKDKEKYIKAGHSKIELFWKAHERTRTFPKDLKNLVERMLHPYGEYRYDIKHIREHKWFNYTDKKKGMYSQEDLIKYLQNRVKTVAKERATKIQKQLEEQGVASVDGGNYKKRGDTSGGGVEIVQSNTQLQLRAKQLDPKNEFSRFEDHIKDDLFFMNSLYQFFTYVPPAEIAARIERVADRGGAKVTISPKNNVVLIRCAVAFDDNAGDEDVIFASKQFLIDDSEYNSDSNLNDNSNTNNNTNNNNNNSNSNDKSDEKENSSNNSNSNSNKNSKKTTILTKRHVVSFKRLKGSHLAYQKAVEDFYAAPEIISAMDLELVLKN